MPQRIFGFIIIFVGIAIGAGFAASALEFSPSKIAVIGFVAYTIILLAFAAVVLWKIIDGEISLTGIVSEPADDKHENCGKASLSRFQFLIFTFVVAGLFLMLSIETGGFVNIPANVLGLIGISGGSYVVSKAVGRKPEEPTK